MSRSRSLRLPEAGIAISAISLLLSLFVTRPAVAGQATDPTMAGAIICSCRCCYMGDCVVLTNGTFAGPDCSVCTANECKRRATDTTARRRIARIFDVLQDFDTSSSYSLADLRAGSSLVATDGAAASDAGQQGVNLPICEIVAVVEDANCRMSSCKVSTNMLADCFDRNDGVVKFVTWAFVFIIFFGIFLAFSKNYIPALQQFNFRHFDY